MALYDGTSLIQFSIIQTPPLFIQLKLALWLDSNEVWVISTRKEPKGCCLSLGGLFIQLIIATTGTAEWNDGIVG